MEFFLGLVTALIFLVFMVASFGIGYKLGEKTPDKVSADDEELRKARENRKAFMNMMNYDVDTALQKKKVT